MQYSQVFQLSLQSLRTNRLRTLLTILGVVVGIFSIIVIMTVITMLQNSIENGISNLAKNTFQIQKFPVFHDGDNRSFRNRKNITVEDYVRLKELLTQAKFIGAEQWWFGIVVKNGNRETNPNVSLAGTTVDALKTNDWKIAEGREFRESDITMSNNVCIMGKEIVTKIFPNQNPVGKEVRINGSPFLVIGVFEEQPQLFGQSRDNYVVCPITTFQSMFGKYDRSVNITVTSYGKEDYKVLIEAAIGYMRTIRKVPASEDNDFDIFSNDSMINQVNTITGGIKIGALAVSLIALLAAGVGIMNIMLVSVTERTREIGIRKAIGARKKYILAQFLFEAIVLCIIGGFIGIVLGVSIGNLVGGLINAAFAIPYDWVIIGLTLCIFVGLLFGTYPAYKAANLDPIEALRYD